MRVPARTVPRRDPADLASARLLRRSTGIPLPKAGSAAASSSELPQPLPFRVHRSRMGNLPIYTDYRNGRTRKVTILRKFAGDVAVLGRALERVCESPVTLYHGRIEVKGLHQQKVAGWLTSLGF